MSLEDFLERERHTLGKSLTPVTKETFAKWKEERLSKKQVEEEGKRKLKEQQAAAGRMNGMSGRDLFTFVIFLEFLSQPNSRTDPFLTWVSSFDTTGVYGDDAYSDGEVEDDGDEWDLAKYREETEAERARQEQERIEKLGGVGVSVGQLTLDG